jgi:hypothetical protein
MPSKLGAGVLIDGACSLSVILWVCPASGG